MDISTFNTSFQKYLVIKNELFLAKIIPPK